MTHKNLSLLLAILVLLFTQTAFSQNVGIGTTTPTRKLTVVSDIFGIVQTNGPDSVGTWLSTPGGAFQYGWTGTLTNVPYALGSGRNNNHITILNNGNVGIGKKAQNPMAAFNVADSSTVLFGKDTLGEGTKMMWLPQKGAFRGGRLNNFSVSPYYYPPNQGLPATFWNNSGDTVGQNSFAYGLNVKAKGEASTALGYYSFASGGASIATGNSVASGGYSTAMGVSIASGEASTAMGFRSQASAGASTALGYYTNASGGYSTAMGKDTKAKSFVSTAMGRYNDTIAGSDPDTWVSTDPLVTVGNGTSSVALSNALTIYKNGNHDINGNLKVAPTKTVLFGADTLGAGTKMMWIPAKGAFRGGSLANHYLGDESTYWNPDSIGINSFAFGRHVKAKGDYSIAMGYYSSASGYNSTAIGGIATGEYSTALRGIASGNSSISFGSGSTASGYNSTAMGNSRATAFGSTSLGYNNDTIAGSSRTSWEWIDPLVMVGNGTALNHLSNALTIYKNGNHKIQGFTQLGDDAPKIKTKKLTGTTTTQDNTFLFLPTGIDPNKILGIQVLVESGGYFFLPHSTEKGYIYTVNTDPIGGGLGQSIAIGVKDFQNSSSVMGKAVKVLITYEE